MSLLKQGYRIVALEGIPGFLASIYRVLSWKVEHLLRVTPCAPSIIDWHVKISRKIMPRRYSDADPFKIIWVNPSEIKTNCRSDTPRSFCRVCDGDWDITINNNTQCHMRVQSIVNHFVNGTAWDDTDYYNKWLKRVEAGAEGSWFGCKTKIQIYKKLNEIDQLYNRIRISGYKLQAQIVSESYKNARIKCNDAPHPYLNEIGVNIGRNGEFIFRSSGLHRLAIGKSLNLEKVPVQIRVRHKMWQQIRDELNSARDYASLSEESKKYISHPDLQDIIPKSWKTP